MNIRPFQSADLERIQQFTDQEIGKGYYSLEELRDILARSQKGRVMCSLLLENSEGRVLGVRISYPPGHWEHGKGHGLHPERWPHPQDQTAYFQSLFLSPEVQGQGWGSKLSLQSLKLLKEAGARGVVCHSWKESPHNSSSRYLQKLGFEIIADHPLYWKDVQYNCTRCLKPPCQCTAQEMYLDLERNS